MVTFIKVKGMMCQHCEARVNEALMQLEGVKSAEANHKKGIVKVEFENGSSVEEMKKAIEKAGYEVQ